MKTLGLIKNIESWVCNSPLELHSADFGIFGASQTPSLVSAPKIPKNYESQIENPSVVDSTRSVESNKKIKSKKPLKSFCYFWLLQKVESSLPLNYNLSGGANAQNLARKNTTFNSNFILSTQETNSSIFDEKSGLRSHEQGNKTDSLLTKRVASLPDLSQKDAEFVRLRI